MACCRILTRKLRGIWNTEDSIGSQHKRPLTPRGNIFLWKLLSPSNFVNKSVWSKNVSWEVYAIASYKLKMMSNFVYIFWVCSLFFSGVYHISTKRNKEIQWSGDLKLSLKCKLLFLNIENFRDSEVSNRISLRKEH